MKISTRYYVQPGLMLLGVLLLGSAAFSAPAQPALKMLFLSRTAKMDAQYLAELQQAGIAVTQRGLTEAISLAEFKSYNLVVIPDFLTLDEAFNVGAVDVPTWWDVTLPNLRAYVQQGGGLLVASFFYGGGEGLATAYNRMLAPWGAGFKAHAGDRPGAYRAHRSESHRLHGEARQNGEGRHLLLLDGAVGQTPGHAGDQAHLLPGVQYALGRLLYHAAHRALRHSVDAAGARHGELRRV